jgi:MHS family proline/betaine transporter-like MFS transporter
MNKIQYTESSTQMNKKKLFFAGAIGNAIEFFEAIVYAFLQPFITKTFFPENFRGNNLLFAFTIIMPFLARPLGALFFGVIGDLKGRKTVLKSSLILSGISCSLIAVIPSYQEIGIFSFIFILSLRFLFGFAMSGEFNNSLLYLAEHAEPKSRGYIMSWACTGVSSGIFMAATLSYLFTTLIEKKIFPIGSFRVLFLLSAGALYIGYYARKHLAETADFFIYFPTFEKNKKKFIFNQAKKGISSNIINTIKIILIAGFGTHITYSLLIYSPFYLTAQNSNIPSLNSAILIIAFHCFVVSILTPIAGKLTDLIGRKFLLMLSIIVRTIFYLFYFFKVGKDASFGNLLVFYAFLSFFDSLYVAGVVEMIESLPTISRSTINGILYGTSSILFGALSLPFFERFIQKIPASPLIILFIAIPLFILLYRTPMAYFKPFHHYKYELERNKIS